MHIIGIYRAGGKDVFLHFHNGSFCGHRHQGIEITLAAMKAQVTNSIRPRGTNKGEVHGQRIFQQIAPAIDLPRFAPFG